MTTAISKDLSLVSCSVQFSTLLERTEITGENSTPLSLEPGLAAIMQILAKARKNQKNIYVIGNGGSAGVASHAVIDLVNVAKLRAFTLHEPALLTCMANDYGYENAFSRILEQMAKTDDVLIAISSAGNSKNIRNAAMQMANTGGTVITFSGFDGNNPLRLLGGINIWLDSNNYGFVEIGHQFILHNISDRFGAGQHEMAMP